MKLGDVFFCFDVDVLSIFSFDDIILLIDRALDACVNDYVMLSFGKRRIQGHGCTGGKI